MADTLNCTTTIKRTTEESLDKKIKTVDKKALKQAMEDTQCNTPKSDNNSVKTTRTASFVWTGTESSATDSDNEQDLENF